MPIPDFQSLMLPLLKTLSDREEHSLKEIIEALADQYNLTQAERSELLPSGQQPIFYNRVVWANTYLKKSCLVETTRRSHYRITERGLAVLQQNPARIDMKFLEQFPEYIEFKKKTGPSNGDGTGAKIGTGIEERTPEEMLEDAYQKIRSDLAQELLAQVLNNTPAFFESLVVELLVKMGYGGSRKEAAKAVGRSGDEGIDGIIDEDRLGLDRIYIQAKRWSGTVGSPEVQKFVGALSGKKAKKGIFITTGAFSHQAREFVEVIETKVVLIDGERLAELMIDNDVGVAPVANYSIKRIDTDYFG
jgi:restriction system protein